MYNMIATILNRLVVMLASHLAHFNVSKVSAANSSITLAKNDFLNGLVTDNYCYRLSCDSLHIPSLVSRLTSTSKLEGV